MRTCSHCARSRAARIVGGGPGASDAAQAAWECAPTRVRAATRTCPTRSSGLSTARTVRCPSVLATMMGGEHGRRPHLPRSSMDCALGGVGSVLRSGDLPSGAGGGKGGEGEVEGQFRGGCC